MIRWMTVQTQWHQYDSPWLAEQELAAFNAENYRRMAAEYLKKPQRMENVPHFRLKTGKRGSILALSVPIIWIKILSRFLRPKLRADVRWESIFAKKHFAGRSGEPTR